MGRLPALSGASLVVLLQKDGFQVIRTEESHVSLRKGSRCTVVPLHDELAKGTLLGILKQAGLSRDDLERLVRA